MSNSRNLPPQLLHADVLEALRGIPSESIDFIFADPPYFLSNDGFTVKSGKAVSVNKGAWDKSFGFDSETDFHEAWIADCLRVLKPNGTIAISGTYHSIYKCGFLLQKLGCRIINDIAWFKPNGAPALAGRNFTASHETILWERKLSMSSTTPFQRIGMLRMTSFIARANKCAPFGQFLRLPNEKSLKAITQLRNLLNY